MAEQKAEVYNDNKYLNREMQILNNQILKNNKLTSHSMPTFSTDILSLFQDNDKRAESDENQVTNREAEQPNFIQSMLPKIPDNSRNYIHLPKEKYNRKGGAVAFKSKSTFSLPTFIKL